MRVLNLGCGSQHLPDAVNLDIADQDGVDIVHDLDVVPWPFADGEFDQVIAFDIYEHVDHPLEFMAECHRVLATGGLLTIHTAFWKNKNSFHDPTHKRFLTEDSFEFWVPGTYWYQRYGKAYGGHDHPFEQVKVWLDTPEGDLNIELRRLDASTPR